MSNKPKQYYLTDEQRRKKRKRHNLIIYIVSAALILTGICIIISDQTFFFKKIENKIIGIDEMPTLPPGSPSIPFVYDTEPPQHTMPTLPPYAYTTEHPDTQTPDHELSTPTGNSTPAGNSTPVGKITPMPTPKATPVPNNAPYAPKYVHFVGYDISCPIDPVGLDSKGEMYVVKSAFRAGWYEKSGDPVHGGNIIIAGHNRYSSKLGYFSIIKDRMKVGDMLILEMHSGEHAYYMVESINQYPYDDVPDSVMMTGGKNRLTLITCLGDYSLQIHTSKHRVIAVCVPVVYDNGDLKP